MWVPVLDTLLWPMCCPLCGAWPSWAGEHLPCILGIYQGQTRHQSVGERSAAALRGGAWMRNRCTDVACSVSGSPEAGAARAGKDPLERPRQFLCDLILGMIFQHTYCIYF